VPLPLYDALLVVLATVTVASHDCRHYSNCCLLGY